MAAAKPIPSHSSSGEIEDVRETLRETLRKLKAKATGRVNEDSKLFKLKAGLAACRNGSA